MCSRSSFWRVFFLAAFLFGAMTLPLAAQQSAVSPPTSAPSTIPLIPPLTLLLQADAKLTELNKQIPLLQQQIIDLQTALQKLNDQTQSDSASSQKQLQDLQDKLVESEKARAVLQSWLVALKTTYDAQSVALQDLQEQAQSVIGDYETALKGERAQKLAWQIGGVTVGVTLAVVSAYELYKYGHSRKWW
jgi:hypothetical protein